MLATVIVIETDNWRVHETFYSHYRCVVGVLFPMIEQEKRGLTAYKDVVSTSNVSDCRPRRRWRVRQTVKARVEE